jgi:hypothetical protein
MEKELAMKMNPLVTAALGLLCLTVLITAAPQAEAGFVEAGHAILQNVDVKARTVTFREHQYVVTSSTELLNEAGMPARLDNFEAMDVYRGVPDRETGSKVYFEADYDHRLLKLYIVDEIPS